MNWGFVEFYDTMSPYRTLMLTEKTALSWISGVDLTTRRSQVQTCREAARFQKGGTTA